MKTPLDNVKNRILSLKEAIAPIPATMSRETALARQMGNVAAGKVAPIPATMSKATATARTMGSAAPVTSTPVPADELALKRAAEKAAELRLKRANPGMTDDEAQNAFIPESRMKKLCEVVKTVRRQSMEEQKTGESRAYAKKQKLTVVAPDHQVADSPNARHLEEVLGRSNMSQLKVPSDRAGAISGVSRPMSQRTRGRYVYGEETVEDNTPMTKKKSAKELKQAEKDGVEVNPQLDDLKQE